MRTCPWLWRTVLATIAFVVIALVVSAALEQRMPQLALRLARATHCNYFQSGAVLMFRGADGAWRVFSDSPYAPLANWLWFWGAWWSGRVSGFAAALLTFALLSRTRRLDGHTHCGDCGYILNGLTQPRCPECGHAI